MGTYRIDHGNIHKPTHGLENAYMGLRYGNTFIRLAWYFSQCEYLYLLGLSGNP